MKIADSTISLNSEHSYKSIHKIEESLRVSVGRTNASPINSGLSAILNISREAQALMDQITNANGADPLKIQISEEDKEKLLLLKKILESLMGKEIRFFLLEQEEDSKKASSGIEVNTPGFAMEYTYRESFYENEMMTFDAKGIVQTQDGREINFSISLLMQREYFEENTFSIRIGQELVDPLIIHYDGNLPSLTEEKYEFDLNMDGNKNMISFAGPGSGFLALDKNNDGIINDGSELFGPSTGNGFHELSAYDEDNNNWIDENDSIFDKLRIWTKDSQGNDRLYTLGEKGIGAIYLGNISSPFELKDQNNNIQGKIQNSGIALKEIGEPVLVQHIDITI